MKRYLKLFLFPFILSVAVTYASDQSGEKIDYSMLPAVSMSKATTAVLLDITRTSSRLIASGEFGIIIYSDDNGQNWQQAKVPVSVTITSIFFLNDQLGWATGHQGVVLHTKDAGESWQIQLTGVEATQIIIDTAEKYKALWEQNLATKNLPEGMTEDDFSLQIDDIAFLIEDKQKALEDGPSEPFFDVWFSSENTGYAIGAYGFLFATTDGGKSWSLDPSYLTNVDKFHFYTFVPFDRENLFLIGESGLVWHSHNTGQTWNKIEMPYDGSFFGGLKTSDNALLAFGLRGNIYKTTDLGKTWIKTKTDHSSSIMGGVQVDKNRIAFVGSDGALLISDDNGKSAQAYTLPKRITNTALIPQAAKPNHHAVSFTIVGKQGIQTYSLDTAKQAK